MSKIDFSTIAELIFHIYGQGFLKSNSLKIQAGGRLTSWLLKEELNWAPPDTNPSSGREEDLKPGSPYYKSSALITRPLHLLRRLLQHHRTAFS